MKKLHGYSPLTEEHIQRLTELAQLSDSNIDTSEIAKWSETGFSEAKLYQEVYKPQKRHITTRIDADVLLWLKSHGRGYQTLLNDILRKEMLEEPGKWAMPAYLPNTAKSSLKMAKTLDMH